jgi:hypothetical protein
VQQPWYCFIENVSNIVTMHEGKVWRAVLSMAKLAGFQVTHSQECASVQGRLPQRRQRVFLTLVRDDIYAEKGFPEPIRDEELPVLTLEDVMLPAQDARLRGLWVDERQTPVTWVESDPDQVDVSGVTGPVEVGFLGDGGWGRRVYVGMVPATKASAWGPDGRTHLVYQRRSGLRAARTLHVTEVRAMFISPRAPVLEAVDPEQAIADYGNSCPARMVLPHADGIMAHIRPGSRFVPRRMSDVVPDGTVAVCRGWMHMVKADFDQAAKLG